jgi:hypothetical protein
MTDIFDVNLENLDLSRISIRPNASAAKYQTDTARDARGKQDMHQIMRDKTISGYIKLCRIFNIDPLHDFSLHIVLILMSKNTDRVGVCRQFMQGVDAEQSTNFDFETATQLDVGEIHSLQSTSDWVTLLQYIEHVPMQEHERSTLMKNERISVFVQSLRQLQILGSDCEVEVFVKPMLCTMLMNIPAANMLERVLLSTTASKKDLEVKCLRAVNLYVDSCQHMSDSTQHEALLLLVLNIYVHTSFKAEVYSALEIASREQVGQSDSATHKKFSLREHLKMQQSIVTLHRAYLFDEWKAMQKFSVTISLKTQRLMYFIKAQQCTLDRALLITFFEEQLVNKLVNGTLEQIDSGAITTVIKTLRIYNYNIKRLIEFRTHCLVGFNQNIRKTLTLPIVLQLYVACFQHSSIRDEVWKSIVPTLNWGITSRCEEFRKKYEYEFPSVMETLMRCHIDNVS